jgi:hypothetical protein
MRSNINCENSDQLIISMEGKLQLGNSLHRLFRSLKKKNSNISSAKQNPDSGNYSLAKNLQVKRSSIYGRVQICQFKGTIP